MIKPIALESSLYGGGDPTQYTSRMGTVRMKQEEEADKNNS